MIFLKKPINKTLKQRAYFWLRLVVFWVLAVMIINLFFSYKMTTPKAFSIVRENEDIYNRILLINSKINNLEREIKILNQRDTNTYRTILGIENSSEDRVINTNKSFHIYAPDSLYNDRYSYSLRGIWNKIDALILKTANCSMSLDVVGESIGGNVEMSRCIPTIWPIDMKDFTGRLCHFGRRLHPILKRHHFHKGLDLGCKRNAPVYAPADGVIEHVRKGWNGGYGNEVLINHGFGYKTRYAHLNKHLVVKGQKVIRGEPIALIGTTGRSTGYHLHYEVIYKGKAVNPINYIRRDMSQDDFKTIIENAKEQNYEREDE